MLPGACLFRAPIWGPSGGGGTREAESTVSESLVASIGWVRTRFGEGGGKFDRRRARGVLNPCARESKAARTGRFLRETVISDHSLFSSYNGRQGAANGQDSWGSFRNKQGFGRLDDGLHVGVTCSRPPPPWTSVFQFSFFLLYDLWP